jgi:predicted nucleic acid-binding protein
MKPVYFDTSVFIALFKPETNVSLIKQLLKQLQTGKVRIYTSMITIQEVSVLTHRRGALARDNFARIAKLARIVNLNKEIALTAAKLEAFISDDAKDSELERRLKHRRKWDCFHIATAQFYSCSDLYTRDDELMGRREQLGIKEMAICPPEPIAGAQLMIKGME